MMIFYYFIRGHSYITPNEDILIWNICNYANYKEFDDTWAILLQDEELTKLTGSYWNEDSKIEMIGMY